jgi:CheY-like chemotaxis protein
LWVDDDISFNDVYRAVLEPEGFHVEFAPSGAEAIKRLECDSDRDIVVIDYMMPGMDGVSTVRKIKERFPTLANKGRLVLVSLLSSGSPQVERLRAEKIEFRQKPDDIDAVLPFIHALLGR